MITKNEKSYDEKYAIGYGIQHPDGHFIRVYKQILEYELGLKSGKVLDFGTGNATHLMWLKSQGDWEVYGTDISRAAIEQAASRLPDDANNFDVTRSYPDLVALYGENQFDFVICNQVLYYVDDKELTHLTEQFERILKPGGVFLATMMGVENFYYGRSEEIDGSDFMHVVLSGRLNESTQVNFKTKEQMLVDFAVFEKLHVGYYDTVIREDEGSTFHHLFVGLKS